MIFHTCKLLKAVKGAMPMPVRTTIWH